MVEARFDSGQGAWKPRGTNIPGAGWPCTPRNVQKEVDPDVTDIQGDRIGTDSRKTPLLNNRIGSPTVAGLSQGSIPC